MATIKIQNRRWKQPSQIGPRLLWQARYYGRWLGWPAGLGLLGLMGALLLYWQVHNARLQQQQLQQQIMLAKAQAKEQAIAKPLLPQLDPAQQDLARQIGAFYRYLPAHASIPDQLKRLLALAQKNGVVLAQGEYKPQPETQAGFLRFQIVLPVKAEARGLQNFMQAALTELPTLTLDSVTFKREKPDSSQIEARIQYQLLVKKAGREHE